MADNAIDGISPRDEATRPYNVLFLCTGNSARSVIAESIMNADSRKRFRAYSAGSMPRGTLDPEVRDFLKQRDYPTDRLRSKSWDEFAGEGAPELHFVFTVCDSAAGEVCPVWPGQPMTAHWGVPDPAAFEGSRPEKMTFIAEVFRMLDNRINVFMELPLEAIDRLTLQRRLADIGKSS
jgi:arsenate reductase (thioredoxin)